MAASPCILMELMDGLVFILDLHQQDAHQNQNSHQMEN